MYFYNCKALAIDKSIMTCKYKKGNNIFNNKKIASNCTLASPIIEQHNYFELLLIGISEFFTFNEFNFINLGKIKDFSNFSMDFWFKLDYRLLFILINTLLSTIILCMLFFSMLAIAERTLQQVHKAE